MSTISDAFAKNFFYNEVNNLVGSGGEFLIKGEENKKSPATLIEVGDYFIGIGITHMVESLSRNPGPDAFRAIAIPAKSAARAFRIVNKEKGDNGFDFKVDALSPQEYSALLARVSDGVVKIAPESIPPGTMILSFLDDHSTYTLEKTNESPGVNWLGTTKGERHWNVGIAGPDDFWVASLPSDDYSGLSQISPSTKIGSIKFGLSLLSGSEGGPSVEPSSSVGPTGKTTTHDFCFSGTLVGTKGLNTSFPIVMRTEITFRPVR